MPLRLTILSPARKLLEQATVEDVVLTGSEGQIQILPGHAPMIGTLGAGPFRYRETGEEASVGAISGGFFEVRDDHVTVLAEALELRGEIDVNRAKRAQAEAEEGLKQADLDEHSFRNYQAQLERAVARQQVAAHDISGH